jgi:Family of unknown function (DUF5519)
MKSSQRFDLEVLSWPEVSAHPHQFAAREYRFGNAEIGHMHSGGTLDIPFPRAIRDALIADGLAQQHRWVPDSGWITFQVREDEDLTHAIWLMRLSYLRYALRTAKDPRQIFDQYCEELRLMPRYGSLIEVHIPKNFAA